MLPQLLLMRQPRPAPPPIRFITNRMCPFAQRAHIALEESGIAFELEEIEAVPEAAVVHAPQPEGQDPGARRRRRSVITESETICDWVADAAPPCRAAAAGRRRMIAAAARAHDVARERRARSDRQARRDLERGSELKRAAARARRRRCAASSMATTSRSRTVSAPRSCSASTASTASRRVRKASGVVRAGEPAAVLLEDAAVELVVVVVMSAPR